MQPKKAVLLSAGLGTRMRPLTLTRPKPLVNIHGRTLLDRALDALDNAGIERVAINVHYLADQIENHVKCRERPVITISDERELLLDSGGGVVKALRLLGPLNPSEPFFILNSDTFWIDSGEPYLQNLARHFDPDTMDMMLLTVRRDQAPCPERGDFLMDDNGRLARAPAGHPDAVIYGGAIITTSEIFKDAKADVHSLNQYFDAAIENGRLYGLPLEGHWYTMGTMAAIDVVERLMTERGEA